MKNLIIIIGTAILGMAIFNMMVGTGSGTMQSAAAEGMRTLIGIYGEIQ